MGVIVRAGERRKKRVVLEKQAAADAKARLSAKLKARWERLARGQEPANEGE